MNDSQLYECFCHMTSLYENYFKQDVVFAEEKFDFDLLFIIKNVLNAFSRVSKQLSPKAILLELDQKSADVFSFLDCLPQ